MAQTSTTTIFIVFTILSLSLLPSKSSSFTLKLTLRDPTLLQSNLTDLQRLIDLVEISEARASYLQQIHNQKAAIRLPLTYQQSIFMTEVGLGTPPVKKTLIFDTASGLTWTQCAPCLACVKQNEPLFEPKKSSSYLTMTKKHPLARGFSCPFFGKTCTYKVSSHGLSSSGVAALESFTFPSNGGSRVNLPSLVFGCTTKSSGNLAKGASGVIGFNVERISFVQQLRLLTNSRFSYCLSPSKPSYVTFRDEAAARGRNIQRTPFVKNIPRSKVQYVLSLLDLGVNWQKLGLGKSAFPQGITIDSGSSLSMLNTRAFAAVTAFLDKYFSQFGTVRRYQGKLAAKKYHCYTAPVGFGSFPSMVFHLQGADYQVPFENVFLFIEGGGERAFCLAIHETTTNMNILGAHQQRNVRFVYDLKEGMLSFGPEVC